MEIEKEPQASFSLYETKALSSLGTTLRDQAGYHESFVNSRSSQVGKLQSCHR
jgi:hypothetical protein